MNSKCLLPDQWQVPTFSTHVKGHRQPILTVPQTAFALLDQERMRLFNALKDRGIPPNDIPPFPQIPKTPVAAVPGENGEMPKYLCHKVVWALKIREVRVIDPEGTAHLDFEDSTYPAIQKDDRWFDKFQPTSGGYYVVYEDGYTSFSPAKAFEEGYTRLP